MRKLIVGAVVSVACAFSINVHAGSNAGGHTLYQIYGGDNGTPVRVYRTPTDGSPPSMDIYYDNRSRSVPAYTPLPESLPGTSRNRNLQERYNSQYPDFLNEE